MSILSTCGTCKWLEVAGYSPLDKEYDYDCDNEKGDGYGELWLDKDSEACEFYEEKTNN